MNEEVAVGRTAEMASTIAMGGTIGSAVANSVDSANTNHHHDEVIMKTSLFAAGRNESAGDEGHGAEAAEVLADLCMAHAVDIADRACDVDSDDKSGSDVVPEACVDTTPPPTTTDATNVQPTIFVASREAENFQIGGRMDTSGAGRAAMNLQLATANHPGGTLVPKPVIR
jgi:hypothetical protein